MITKEEFLELQKYEPDLTRAFKAKYKLPCTREEDDTVVRILHTHEPSFRVNRSCGNCMFRVYERVGRWYFEYKEWLEKQPKEEEKKDEVLSTGGTAKIRKSSRKQDKQLS